MHPLDRPVWASLTTHHAGVSVGGALARRFVPDVHRFAAARDESADALAALGALVAPGESVFVLQVPPVGVPPGLVTTHTATGLQMVATRAMPADAAHGELVTLGDADAPEMLALARLTEPGPYYARTHTLGRFLGVRIDGRLAAMAGERMRLPGWTEVSGVCTHPDFRGRGLARRLSAAVAAAIAARGDRAVLHVWQANRAAIALYESLGFEQRTEVHVVVLAREAA